jgi:hypothetical protein
MAVITTLATGIAVAGLRPGEIADRFATGDPIGVTVADSADIAVAAAAPFNVPAGHLAKLPPVSTAPVLLSHVLLYLRGQRNESVLITNISIRVLRRGPMLHGLLEVTRGAGAGQPAIRLSVLVDGPVPWLTEDTTSGTTSNLEPYFRSNYITLQHDETTLISIAAGATHDYFEWDIRVDYLVAGQSAHLIVNRTGVLRTETDGDRSPFRITAAPPTLQDYQQIYIPAPDGGWDEVPRDALCPGPTKIGAVVCGRSP